MADACLDRHAAPPTRLQIEEASPSESAGAVDAERAEPVRAADATAVAAAGVDDGETIILAIRPHWAADPTCRGSIAAAVILWAAGGGIAAAVQGPAALSAAAPALLVLLAAMVGVGAWLGRLATVFILTDRRVIRRTRRRLVSPHCAQAALSDIERVSAPGDEEASPPAIGAVEFHTGAGRLVWHGVRQPREVKRIAEQAIDRYARSRRSL